MFDDALVESRKPQAPGGRRLSLPLAVGLHVLVIGAFVGASTWFTGEAPEPAIPIVFPVSSSAPPPPPGNGGVARAPRGSRPHAASPLVQPDPSSTAALAATPDETGMPAGDPSDSTGEPGLFGGDENGTGPLQAVTIGEPAAEPIFIPGGDVHAPKLLQRVEPDYPEAARRAHLEGTLILEATITAIGAVAEVRVLRPLNPLLDEAAERALLQWRYRPATLNGRAVPVYLTVTVRFGIAR